MPTPAQRSAIYRAQQRELLGEDAYKIDQAAKRQARRNNERLRNNPPPPLPVNLPSDIDDIAPPIPPNNPFVPPRPNAQKLKQLLQAQKQPPAIPPRPKKQPPAIPPRPKKQPPAIPPRPKKPQPKFNSPMMGSDDYLNRINNIGIDTQPIQKPIQKPIQQPIIPKSRLNILLNTHNKKELNALLPKENIRDEVKETTLKQYNNKVLNFFNKYYRESYQRFEDVPEIINPLEKKYNIWLEDDYESFEELEENIHYSSTKNDTRRALTTAILSLVERNDLYDNRDKLKKRLRKIQKNYQDKTNEKKN